MSAPSPQKASSSPAQQPRIARTVDEVRSEVAAARKSGRRIGVVPTMGALHAGHLSLIEAARRECGFVVTTIFVNPTQFGPNEDFGKYPRPFSADVEACRSAGVDLIFHPEPETMYAPHFSTSVEVEGLSSILEGRARPGHFRGVTTVVLKLLNIVTPDVAYFGQKDYQQQAIIRKMCADLNVPVEIVTCPTIRDPDGLAMSSRNVYLRSEERESALSLSRALKAAAQQVEAGETDLNTVQSTMLEHLQSAPGVDVDYAVLVHPETLDELQEIQQSMVALIAARVGTTRLIDNGIINAPSSGSSNDRA